MLFKILLVLASNFLVWHLFSFNSYASYARVEEWKVPLECGLLLDEPCFKAIIEQFDQLDWLTRKKDGKIDIFDITQVNAPQHIDFLNDLIDTYSCYPDGDIDEKDIRQLHDPSKGRDGLTCEVR